MSVQRTERSQARAVRSARRACVASACACVAVVGYAAYLRWWSDQSWLGVAIVLLPRWPWAVLMALLWAWCLWSRAWKTILVLLVATCVTLFPVMGLRVSVGGWVGKPATSADATSGRLRVVTFNVHRAKLDASGFAAFLDKNAPDVVALQDWSSVHMDTLFGGEGWHARRSGEFLVASRFPIIDVEPIDLALDPAMALGEQGEAAAFRLDTPFGEVAVVNVHFASPHNGVLAFMREGHAKLEANHARRAAEMRLARAAVNDLKVPYIVVGDFNTTDPSPLFRGEWSGHVDSFAHVGSGFGYTYYNRVAQLRLDRVLVSAGLRSEACWVGPFFGSPHRPVVADLRVVTPKVEKGEGLPTRPESAP